MTCTNPVTFLTKKGKGEWCFIKISSSNNGGAYSKKGALRGGPIRDSW